MRGNAMIRLLHDETGHVSGIRCYSLPSDTDGRSTMIYSNYCTATNDVGHSYRMTNSSSWRIRRHSFIFAEV